ncbi:uncharacterized protein N7506_005685 [Penicillium brevicompactum]|uniref:uncharacterized protein n=1 Tax=Penicillium brevicompactum TaxID=5074 RepID=UPI00254077CE|nr:uncharacterized protein N7506_005685 [Penicillium brevicompactum]KAJ5335749.1 hypothetical protein N7506_005685 [Penicillium brevicompactum]
MVDAGQRTPHASDSEALILKNSWSTLPLRPLQKHNSTTVVKISRPTFITLLCLTNSRQVISYSDSSGYRASFPSYCGRWYLEWRIGGPAFARLGVHDSHTLCKDPYPEAFEQRVDACLQMLAGVVESRSVRGFRCGFPGRKSSGKWVLEYEPRGFGGAHSGRHLYHMIGGNVNEVSFLRPKAMNAEVEPPEGMVVLRLPNKHDGGGDVTLYIPEKESTVLNEALDNLSWTFLSWSLHRGLRDILVAFGKERMARYRRRLALTLREAVTKWPERLVARGWNSQFVRETMADMAESAVLASQGNSADVVRIVTDIAVVLQNDTMSDLDKTIFWRHGNPCSSTLDSMTIIALVKYLVLEWSVEFDYQLYNDLPEDIHLG